jgi:A/G-specific adenine glycosylase
VSRTPTFAARVIAWQARAGRHHLPWQNTQDPYRIWLSEIMLQQTQVSAVIPYYTRFLTHFPSCAALANAPLDAVLAQWAGLGYYTRARNLHAAAQLVRDAFAGVFPRDAAAIATLPGIGRSTANAIAAFAYGEHAAILDGNVKRVLARHAGIAGYPGERSVEHALWSIAQARLPATTPPGTLSERMQGYTQGLMDLGASTCTRRNAQCDACPVQADCVAQQTGRVEELPTPRPSKALPERSVTVAWVTHDRHTLLEKRPPRGIWGGLFSLPEVHESGGVWLADTLRAKATSHITLPAFNHSFTHFKLAITPLRIALRKRPETLPPDWQWVSAAALDTVALPAPIERLLSGIH